ncbi:MAG: DNA-3-methyladenine glycosylase 2 family protein [Streptosporangiales bacterium]|nr:DNA-3-methyladenine glycosylase 2 family protein [Streptosporangiales bacterium]
MPRHQVTVEVLGPWSLTASRSCWEGFAPAALPVHADRDVLRTVFLAEGDRSRAEVELRQDGATATVTVIGAGDLDAAAAQAGRFLALDVDARGWPAVGRRDPVIGRAQDALPGLRPCGFHSPYEAAAWAVLSQRLRIGQAAKLRADLVARHGADGAFPAPAVLRGLDLDLPGRKGEYLRAVADAALDGVLACDALRAVDPELAVRTVQEVKGLGPFAAELVVVRGANAPDALPTHERRMEAEVAERYGPHASLTELAEDWRPFRTWACVHLRALRERRAQAIDGQGGR